MALTPEIIKKDIDELISKLIEKGICDDSNFSSIRQLDNSNVQEVCFSGSKISSIVLRNMEYEAIYRELAYKRWYNIRLIDGALIQMMYRLENDELLQHKLAFYPSPILLPFQDIPDEYINDDMFIEIIHRRIIPFPLRFDFDARHGVYIDMNHPKAHLTLGDVKGCRIPVSAPVTPRWFIEFILRNFYQTEEYDFVSGLPRHRIRFEESITSNERSLVHVVIPYEIMR